MTIPAGQLRLVPLRRGSGARRYGILLLILVVTYLLSAFTVAGLVSAVQVLLFLAVVLIALRNGRLRRRTARFVAVGLLLGSGISAILQVVDPNGYGGAVSSSWTAMILLLAVFFIVREVLSQPEITLQSIFGVLSTYMMIGLIYSAVYVAIWKFSGQPFFVGVGQNDTNTKEFQYFSFTTLTTLGYGDFTAVGDGGRAVAVLEAIVGQMFLATLVARLVAGFRWSDRAAARNGGGPAATAAGQGSRSSGSGRDESRAVGAPASPGSGDAAAGQPRLSHPSPGPASAGRTSPGPSRAKQASAPGLVWLSPPGAVRGRGPAVRRGRRNGAGGSGPAPAARPPGTP
jgi:hypothetical protein